MKLNFVDLIPECKFLSAEKVREAGFVSDIFPELPSSDEIRRVATAVNTVGPKMWSYEFGSMPHEDDATSLPNLVEIYERSNYMNILMKFGDKTYFWVPDHHEYFVLFGEKEAIARIIRSRIFEYTFDEYLEEEFHSRMTRDTLEKARHLYNWGTLPKTSINLTHS